MQKLLAILAALIFGLTSGGSPVIAPKPQLIKIIFTGDLSFDRHIRQMANQNHGYDFILSPLKDLFNSVDLVVVNLETPITNNPSVSLGSIPGEPRNFQFTSPPETAAVLASYNIKLVNLGNNHTLNFGVKGLEQTYQYLTQAGIDYFDTGRSVIKTINQLNFGFVNYNQFANGSLSAALADLETLRPKVDILIVFCHWGIEYQTSAGLEIQTLAHQFIELGADLVIGTHPHVIQQSEVYQGKKIYYSLGNFVFDQYFSQETSRGMLVEVIIDPENLNSLETKEFYVQMDLSGQTKLINKNN